MIPHLTTDHCEHETQGNQSPSSFVVQEVKVISSHVEKNGGDGKEYEHGDGSCVIWWTENSNIDFSSFINPPENQYNS